MKLKGVNASSKKTINIIKSAFAELLEEKKEINNITVTELVKRANITRGAFYSHYDNLYDIAEEIESEIQEVAFSNIKKISSKDDISDFLNSVFDYIKNNEDFYKKLVQSNDPLSFLNRLSKKFFLAFKDSLKKESDDYDIALRFCTDGSTLLIIKYLKGETNYSLEEINNYLNKAINKLL